MPPGHVPAAEAGTEFVMFSPTPELRPSEEALVRNLQAMQQA